MTDTPPWIREVVACCQAGVSTGDLTMAHAQIIIQAWIQRLTR
jgi:hypothetical protein